MGLQKDPEEGGEKSEIANEICPVVPKRSGVVKTGSLHFLVQHFPCTRYPVLFHGVYSHWWTRRLYFAERDQSFLSALAVEAPVPEQREIMLPAPINAGVVLCSATGSLVAQLHEGRQWLPASSRPVVVAFVEVTSVDFCNNKAPHDSAQRCLGMICFYLVCRISTHEVQEREVAPRMFAQPAV